MERNRFGRVRREQRFFLADTGALIRVFLVLLGRPPSSSSSPDDEDYDDSNDDNDNEHDDYGCDYCHRGLSNYTPRSRRTTRITLQLTNKQVMQTSPRTPLHGAATWRIERHNPT